MEDRDWVAGELMVHCTYADVDTFFVYYGPEIFMVISSGLLVHFVNVQLEVVLR